MRVGMLAPTSWRVPPRHYGPWEQFVSLLTEGLVARGVEVTLFATGDSQTAAKLISVMPSGYSEAGAQVDVKVWESLHISEVFERAGEFDLIHNSFDFLPLTYSSLVSTPMLTTIHGFSNESILPVYQKYNGQTHYVAISEADRHPTLDYLATIHHGIDTDAFALHPEPGPYLLFFGRIHPEKGTAEAITVARRTGRPLIIAGIIGDHQYFEEQVAPHVDGTTVTYLGPVGPSERQKVLGQAHALLHLIDFEEPFGFSVAEALASGTPVIAFERGSMAELIDHGGNGFLTHDIDEATAAVGLAADLDRGAIHREAILRFGRDRMVEQYLEVYRRILDPSRLTIVGNGHCDRSGTVSVRS
jgi:glycosyltransferase involved in cell wall biosynthesis